MKRVTWAITDKHLPVTTDLLPQPTSTTRIQATESENVSESAKDHTILGQDSATGSLSVVSIPGPAEQLQCSMPSSSTASTELEKSTACVQADIHPGLDHGFTKEPVAVATSSSLVLHSAFPSQSNVSIANNANLSLPVL